MMAKRLFLLVAGLLILVACGGGSGGSDTGSNAGTGTRVKESEAVAVAPLPPPADDTEGPAARGATSITSDAAAACLTANEAELARLVNEYRASLNLPAVPVSKSLTLVAQQHAWDSETNGTAWPPPPPGKACNMHSWTDRVNPALQEGTWTAVCYTGDHANAQGMWNKPGELAGYPGRGVENSFLGIGATPSGVLNAWKNSPGHNAVIIEQGWDRPLAMGVGMNGLYAHLWFGYVADPAGQAQLCSGPSQPTTPLPTPTTAVGSTVQGATVPATPDADISATSGSRRSLGVIVNENGTVSAPSLMRHQFAVVRGRSYTIVVTPSAELDVNPYLTCTTNAGGLRAPFDWNWEGGVETFDYNAPGDGTCTVDVSGYEGSTGTYNITVTAR